MKCVHCGEDLVEVRNPEGPETLRSDAGWGCLQAAFDAMPELVGEDDEPDVPYPPHVLEAAS